MNKKLRYLFLVLLPLLLMMTLTAAALPVQQEMVGISPPGWLGGVLTILSLILPVGLWFWMRREKG